MTERRFGDPRQPGDRTRAAADRHSSWLELFFDLAFVFAVTTISTRLGDDAALSWAKGLTVLGLFTVIWWAWIGQAFFDTRFDYDDVPQRLSVLAAMVGAGAMAVGISEVPRTALFPIGYLIVRTALLGLYLRVAASHIGFGWVTHVYLPGFGIGWLVWLGSLLAPADTRPGLWAFGLVIELLTPWVGRYLLKRAPVNTSHLPERIGLFTIILLGATLTELLDAVSDAPYARVFASAVVAFCVPASLWWIYSGFVSKGVSQQQLKGGQSYAYLHGCLGAALLLLGWGLGQSLRLVGEEVDRTPMALRVVLTLTVATWMICGIGLQRVTFGTLSATRMCIAAGGIALTTVVTLTMPTPVLTIAALAVSLVAYAAVVNRHLARTNVQTDPLDA
ncbi:low temperature requirement protein A [Micromonospora sonneratiae]|uniref:Low temperature requirement protein A n=1 Tax=Micromonospora sonneratiae TaxID=1184706 RepID=A0ABW3YMT7_9ACTN